MSGVPIIRAIRAGELLAPGYVSFRNSFRYFLSCEIINDKLRWPTCYYKKDLPIWLAKRYWNRQSSTSSLDRVSAIGVILLFFRFPEAALFFLSPPWVVIPPTVKYSSNCCSKTVSITSFAAPWLQIVTAGNSTFLIEYAVVLMVVIVGLACHSTYVLLVEYRLLKKCNLYQYVFQHHCDIVLDFNIQSLLLDSYLKIKAKPTPNIQNSLSTGSRSDSKI